MLILNHNHKTKSSHGHTEHGCKHSYTYSHMHIHKFKMYIVNEQSSPDNLCNMRSVSARLSVRSAMYFILPVSYNR